MTSFWRRLRVLLFYCGILAFLAAFAGYAYLTRHPESPWLEEAQEWPVVGELARSFRHAYLGPPSSGPPGEPVSEDTLIAYREDDEEPGSEEPLTIFLPEGQRARVEGSERRTAPEPQRSPSPAERLTTPGPELKSEAKPKAKAKPAVLPGIAEPRFTYLVEDWRWFRPGQQVRVGPASDAHPRVRLEALSWLPVLTRNGSWAEVVHHGDRGWIDTSWEPPYKRKWATRGLLRHRHEPVRHSDWGRYQEARKLLGIEGKPDRQVGAYTLLTDVDDRELLAFLDRAAIVAEDAYFARYGRLPSGNPGRSVVLFAREADYRKYSESANVASDSHVGHAGIGIATFFAEGRSRADLTRTLVHEIGHLLNARALAWRLPPWLEEGIATDLGSVWLEDDPVVTGRGAGVENWGPDSRIVLLGQILDQGQLPTVEVLMYADREAFFKNSRVQKYAYAHSLGVVRYLLDPDQGHAEGFRELLKKIADGRGADPELLAKLLDVDLEELDQGFRAWLRLEAAAAQQRLRKLRAAR